MFNRNGEHYIHGTKIISHSKHNEDKKYKRKPSRLDYRNASITIQDFTGKIIKIPKFETVGELDRWRKTYIINYLNTK